MYIFFTTYRKLNLRLHQFQFIYEELNNLWIIGFAIWIFWVRRRKLVLYYMYPVQIQTRPSERLASLHDHEVLKLLYNIWTRSLNRSKLHAAGSITLVTSSSLYRTSQKHCGLGRSMSNCLKLIGFWEKKAYENVSRRHYAYN